MALSSAMGECQCFVNVSQHVWCGRMRKLQSLRVNRLLLVCLWALMLRTWASCVWWNDHGVCALFHCSWHMSVRVLLGCFFWCPRVATDFMSVTVGVGRAVLAREPDWSPTTGWNTCADLSWCSEWPSVAQQCWTSYHTTQPKIDVCMWIWDEWVKMSVCAVAVWRAHQGLSNGTPEHLCSISLRLQICLANLNDRTWLMIG